MKASARVLLLVVIVKAREAAAPVAGYLLTSPSSWREDQAGIGRARQGWWRLA